LWWIRHRPSDLDRGAELFWQAVDGVLVTAARERHFPAATVGESG
jgi:hypothetical protein